jgi:hypothetical protein
MEQGWVFEGGNDSLYNTSGSTGIGKNSRKRLWHGYWRTGYTMVLQVYRRPLKWIGELAQFRELKATASLSELMTPGLCPNDDLEVAREVI